jgi:hypothetical protein
MKITFEYVPEHYTGEYPYAVVRIKQSRIGNVLTARLR